MSPAVQWGLLYVAFVVAVIIVINGLLGIRWLHPTGSAIGFFVLGSVLILGAVLGLVSDIVAWSIQPDGPDRFTDNLSVGLADLVTGAVGVFMVTAGMAIAQDEGDDNG